MKKYIILTVLSVIGFTVSTFSQTTNYILSGTVSSSKGKPIKQARVYAQGMGQAVYSNNKGKYSLKLPSNKKCKITVSHTGYKPLFYSIILNKNEVRNFVIEQDTLALVAVVVYGKSDNRIIKEGSFSANSIDIKQQSATISNLSSIVGRSSGVNIRQDGSVGGSFDMSVNGLSGNSVRYFIDGIPISAMGASINLENIPVNTVNRVEIYKGVVPTHLGADALGGAVNIITTNKKNNYIDASYGFGSFNTHKINLTAKYVFGKSDIIIQPTFGYIYSKNNYTVKDVEVWNDNVAKFVKADRKRFHNDYLSIIGQVDVGIRDKKWTDAFFISTSYTKTNKKLQTGSTQKVVYGNAERNSNNYRLAARYVKNNFLFKNLKAKLLLSYTLNNSVTIDTAYRKYDWNGDYINSSRNEITGREKSYRHYERPLLIGRANLNYIINAHHNLNFNYLLSRLSNRRYDDFDSNFEETKDVFAKHIFGLSYRQRFFNSRLINTFFVKDYLSHLEVKQLDLYWITGSKENQGSMYTNKWGYGAGSRFKFYEALFVKASYEHSMHLPLARELLGNGTTIYPNFALQPETSNNFNIGLLGNINSGNLHRFTYEGNFFLRNTKNYIMLVLSEAEGLSQYKNVSNVDIKGVEADISYTFANKFKIQTNASYLDERSKTKYQLNGKPDITYNNRMPNRPWLYANASIEYMFDDIILRNSKLKLTYDFQYVHQFYLTWESYGSLRSKSTIPSQYVSNVGASYAIKNNKYSVSAECSNIFNSTVYDNYMMQKPGRAFFVKFKVIVD